MISPRYAVTGMNSLPRYFGADDWRPTLWWCLVLFDEGPYRLKGGVGSLIGIGALFSPPFYVDNIILFASSRGKQVEEAELSTAI